MSVMQSIAKASASTAALAVTLLFATAATAQDAGIQSPECPDMNNDGVCDPEGTLSNADGTPEGSGTIVVTGSRIRRDNFSSLEPITVITAEEITQAGFNSAADALQGAAVTAGSGQVNNFFGGFVVAGGTGVNTLGLRGLGPARTLILLNGRRIAPAGTRGSVLAADLNVLPTSIVERVEILKAGASSIYGSDAIAGVVNIITDSQVRGLSLEAQVNIPEVGEGVDRRMSATFGFGNDRLDVVGSVEYRKRNALRLNDVDFTSCPIGGYLDGEGSAFGSGDFIDPLTGEPKCFTLDNGGVTINTLGVPTRQAISRSTGALGNFNRLLPAPEVTTGPTPGYLGVTFYTRDSFDPDMREEEVITPVETYTGFLSASYDLDFLGDADIYGEILATRRKSSSLLYRQLSIDYSRGSPLVPLIFRNGTFANANEISSGMPVAARAFVGFGLTESHQAVDYVRAGVGLRGDFVFPGWRYDAYLGKSWTDGRYEIESFLIDRMASSLQVVQNGDGSFSCVSAASNANCVAAPPLNADTIGGNLPQAWRDYILVNTIGITKFRESTAIFSVDGPLFALPGGDVQLALGAEYRKQRIDDTPDPEAQRGNLFGLTASVPTRGTDNVKELYGEIFLPILANRPFFENLNLNASTRYTDYASYGSDVTFKVAGEWEFFRGFGIRGSYGTSYRAPALSEQFLGATSGFLGGANDPCDSGNFPDDPAGYSAQQQLIATNCASIGLDVTTFTQNSSVVLLNLGGAETGLAAETSKNWSVGVVVQPRLPDSIGSLALALDYFNIKVENGVTTLTGGTILNRCFTEPDFNPADGFCRFVTRDNNNELTVVSGFINLATDIVKGFEFTGRYSRDLFGGRLVLNASVTKYTEQSDKQFPEEFLRDSNGIFTNPDWVGTFDATYRTGPVTLRYGFNWQDGSSGSYDYFAFNRTTGQVDENLAQQYRDFYLLEVPSYFLHNASVQFNVNNDLEFTVGVRNIFDTEPPRISAAVATVGNAPVSSLYDYTGRQFFVNTSFRF